MPCWYYEKKDLKNTPSIRDGMDFETERRYRKEGTRFIMECGTEMRLGHNTIATGAVYFHRFYMFHSFQEFPRYETACCCLFLAGKVEETPKKCSDIITTARSMLPDAKFQAFSDDIRRAKSEVMTLESILLQTIKFDLEVDHPYNFLLQYAKCLKGDKAKLQKMVQMAWNFVNDSLSTTVCLQWEPEVIAIALIHLASKLSKFSPTDWIGRLPNHLRWWDMFISDVTMEILEDICHQVLDLYQSNQQQQQQQQSNQPQTHDHSLQSSSATTLTAKTNKLSPLAKDNSPLEHKTISPPTNNGIVVPQTSFHDRKDISDTKPIHVMPTNGNNIDNNLHYMYPPYPSYASAMQQMPNHQAMMQPSIYPANPYLHQSTMVPTFNMQHPQCAQQAPHHNQHF